MYVLLRGSEDGNPVRFLTPTNLRDLLDDPIGTYGVHEFGDAIPTNPDHNYWPDGYGLLLKVEIIQPVPSGAYRLPEEGE